MQYLNFLMNEWPGKNDYTMKVSAEFFSEQNLRNKSGL